MSMVIERSMTMLYATHIGTNSKQGPSRDIVDSLTTSNTEEEVPRGFLSASLGVSGACLERVDRGVI